jgi:hypothetical protein
LLNSFAVLWAVTLAQPSFLLELATDLCDMYGARGVFGRMSNDAAYVQFICKIFSIKMFSYTLFSLQKVY